MSKKCQAQKQPCTNPRCPERQAFFGGSNNNTPATSTKKSHRSKAITAKAATFNEHTGTLRFGKGNSVEQLAEVSNQVEESLNMKRNTHGAEFVKVEDKHGYARGVHLISKNNETGMYSYGRSMYNVYRPEWESKNLKAVLKKASEETGFNDDERVLDADVADD